MYTSPQLPTLPLALCFARVTPLFATDPRNRQLSSLFATHPSCKSFACHTCDIPHPPTALPPRPFLFGGFLHTSSCFLRPGPANLTNRQPIWAATGLKKKTPGETFTKEFLHGFNGLEGTPHFRFDFDSGAADHGGAHRAHQLQPAPQGMPHARQAAFVLPDAQPHHRALRSGEGLRIRKRSVRALRRNGTRQNRAGLGKGRGDSRVREAGRSGSGLFRRVV